MLKGTLLHPEILRVLASSGHFSQILIADGNYPVATHAGPNAARVHLNLTHGIPKTTDVLRVLLDAVPVQSATLMEVPSGETPAIHGEYIGMLPPDTEVRHLERHAFYDAVRSPLTSLVIATGEVRRFANLLLSVGVVKLDRSESY